jgi:hypothetical protein
LIRSSSRSIVNLNGRYLSTGDRFMGVVLPRGRVRGSCDERKATVKRIQVGQ